MHQEAPACEPGAEYWNATASFKDDISEVFPYLNAQWKDAIYSPGANQLTFRFEDREAYRGSARSPVTRVRGRGVVSDGGLLGPFIGTVPAVLAENPHPF